jgi:CRISPR-associated protein Csm4
MAETWLYKLRPLSPFHFGERSARIESTDGVFHSDSLFGALATGIRMWHGAEALGEILSRFQERPPFRVASLFPYAGDVLFFPMPMLTLPLEREAEDTHNMRLKNVRFVSRGILEALLHREALDGHLSSDNLYQGGGVWSTREERASLPLPPRPQEEVFWRRQVVSTLSVDRMVAASQVYRTGLVRFSPDCGLYFLVEMEDTNSKAIVENALDYLSQAGLGGKRSAGHGQFSVQSARPFAPFWPTGGDLFVTLSLYHPTLEELENGVLTGQAAYQLRRRDGWVSSPERAGQRRKSTCFIGEGSVLRSLAKASYGELVDATPQSEVEKHPVYRYGYAFPIGVQAEGPSNEP